MFGIEKQDTWAKKGLKLTIFAALFFTPLVFSTNHFFFFMTPKYVLVSVLGSICFVLLGICLLEAKFLLDKKTKAVLYLTSATIVWFFIASYLGIDFQISFWSDFSRHTGFLTYFFSFVLFLSSLFVWSKETIVAPLRALTLGGALSALSIYFSPALLDVNLFFLKNSSNAGTFGNTTYAGIFLVFSFFSSLILISGEKTRNKKIIWTICALLILLCPVFLNIKNIFTLNLASFSSFMGEARAGLISILLGLIFSLILYFYFNNKKVYSILAKVALVSLFIAAIFIAVNVFKGDSKLHNYILNQKEGVRLVYWDMALSAIGERPLLGYGLENFYQIHKKYFDPVLMSPIYPEEPWSDKMHNNILEITFSTGVVGLFLYLTLVGFIFISLIKKAKESESGDRVVASLLFGLLISYFFQDFFAFDTVSSLQVFFVILALISIFCFSGVRPNARREVDKYIKPVIFISLVIMGSLMMYFFSFKVRQESKMTRRMVSMSIQERTSIFEKTMNTSPVGTRRSESQYIDQSVSIYRSKWPSLAPEIRDGLKKELEFLLRYSKNKSDEEPEDFRFALMVSRIGNLIFGVSNIKDRALLDDSLKYGIRAIQNSPFSHIGYRSVVETFLLENNFDSAMKFAQMMINLNPQIPSFHDVAIYVAKLEKNEKLVNEKTEEAKKFIPNYEYGLDL